MTGEMTKDELTREAFPLHFAAADLADGAEVRPFDYYQGPFVNVPAQGNFWLVPDNEGQTCQWWRESDGNVTPPFFPADKVSAAEAFQELLASPLEVTYE